ncbi:MAG: carboxypeptidase-like regulatory domain-containing protein, partial [Bacteroidetes bacterium]|nr:carboxypeptidase-like regulatory domain-containing protein [Bacteroidota bacterium]
MKKYCLFSIVFILTVSIAQAQFTITGTIKDTADVAIPLATVMLLNPKDTTLANYTSSDAKGNFTFRNVRKSNYIFKTTHISFMPREIFIQPAEEKEINLGTIVMKPIANFLMEIVIKEA